MAQVDLETQALLRQLSDDSAQKAVDQTLLTLGIDKNNPIEAQRDFAALRELRAMSTDPDFQKDLIHLRRWRKTMDQVQSKGMLAGLGLMCIGGLALLVSGVKFKIGG